MSRSLAGTGSPPAARADCRLLLSEDMAEGFTWGGVSVANPFAAGRHALLAAPLEAGSP